VAEPKWLREDVVLAIQRCQLAEHGGVEGIRDLGLLASALARPRYLLAYSAQPPDLAALAAAYALGITRNHPFVDGNKRTALVVARTFLKLNGQDFDGFLSVAEGKLTEDELAAWIRLRLTSL
jgi:death-on-curing protein